MAECWRQEPEYLSYLLSPELDHDSYFVVGNKSRIVPERIGAVKRMLMAHSVVLRRQLGESKLSVKSDIPVEDMYPDTFRDLVRYIYGYDTTTVMSFDAADNLLYAADKYMMKPLKDKLASRLMKLLNADNICSLLNNPVCHTQLELNSAITQILQFETDRVLSSSNFPGLCEEGFVYILQQEGLAVPEMELWRAALHWAREKAGTEEGSVVRREMSRVVKHIRICTFTPEEFCGEVGSADVLTRKEIKLVCRSISKQEKQEDLVGVCNEITPRKLLSKPCKLSFSGREHYRYNETAIIIITKSDSIELQPLQFSALPPFSFTPEDLTPEYGTQNNLSSFINILKWVVKSQEPCVAPVDATYWVRNCLIRISEIGSSDGQHIPCLMHEIEFTKQVEYGVEFVIPLTGQDGKNITLLPHRKYYIEIYMVGDSVMYFNQDTNSYDNDHLTVTVDGSTFGFNGHLCNLVPMRQLFYRPVSAQ